MNPEKALDIIYNDFVNNIKDPLLENDIDYSVFTHNFTRFKDYVKLHNQRQMKRNKSKQEFINWKVFWCAHVINIMEGYYGAIVQPDIAASYFESGLRPNDACIKILRNTNHYDTV